VQKYVGEGARMVREMFQLARSKKACLIFFDEVDSIGGARFDDGQGGDNEVQRTMLEIVNQLDGFDARGNIKVSSISFIEPNTSNFPPGSNGYQPPRHARSSFAAPWPYGSQSGIRPS
jgi:SpoVK/Ycf46/Vps4 family AAA+-type ATPase